MTSLLVYLGGSFLSLRIDFHSLYFLLLFYCKMLSELPKVYIKEGVEVSVIGESQFSLHCYGEGQPLPRLQWSKLDGKLSSKAIETADGSLHFPKITSTDSGRYRCTATNDFGSVIAEVHLRVEGNTFGFLG